MCDGDGGDAMLAQDIHMVGSYFLGSSGSCNYYSAGIEIWSKLKGFINS